MANQTYGDQYGGDRTEMFAIGAAAGALVATAIQEILERRRQKTPVERISERVSELANKGGDYAQDLRKVAGNYVDEIQKQGGKQLKQSRKQLKQSRKQLKKNMAAATKQAKRSTKQTGGLIDVATGALGAIAGSKVVEQAKDFVENARPDHDASQAKRWFQKAGETVQASVESARDAITDAVPAKTTNGVLHNVAETAGDYLDAARSAVSEGKVADRAADTAQSTRNLLSTASEALRQYLDTARDAVADAEIGPKAREYASTAGDTIKDVAETAKDRLSDAELGPKAREVAGFAAETLKDYRTKAEHAAKTSAEKISESASQAVETTTAGARDLQQGVRTGVKRTRRRVNWGLRAFIVGIVVGVLSAPQSGERTRATLQGFVEDLLELVMPDNSSGTSGH